MTNQSEFYFAVEHLTGDRRDQKRAMTGRLIAFALSSFVVYCAYILGSVAFPGFISTDGGMTSLVTTLSVYLVVGVAFVVTCLRVFSVKQEARWILK